MKQKKNLSKKTVSSEMGDKEKIKLLEKQIGLLEKVIELQKMAQPIPYPVYIPYYEPYRPFSTPVITWCPTSTTGTATCGTWGGTLSDCSKISLEPITYTAV